MTYKEAVEILQQFNAWRRYRGEEVQPAPVYPYEIGKAIDVAIEAMKTHPAPDWSDAPEWAQWYAIDPDNDGEGAEKWFYEKEPFMGRDAAHTSAFGETEFVGRTVLKWKRPE